MNYEITGLVTLERLDRNAATILAMEQQGVSNLIATVSPSDRAEFERRGWQVSGVASNYGGLGQHALTMTLRLNRPVDALLLSREFGAKQQTAQPASLRFE